MDLTSASNIITYSNILPIAVTKHAEIKWNDLIIARGTAIKFDYTTHTQGVWYIV